MRSILFCMKTKGIKVSLYRQKILLALIEAFGGKLTNRDLQKYLFLFTQICQKNKSYEFVPYKYGCFSFQSYADRTKLIDIGAISSDPDNWNLVTHHSFLDEVNAGDKTKLGLFSEKYSQLKGEDLVKEVYTKYPYFAIKSEIADKLLDKDQLAQIDAQKPTESDYYFFTIGYEGKTIEAYVNELIQNNVKVLCDVRKNPLSRKYGFSKKTLSEITNSLGIEYIHIPDLGIVSEKRQILNSQADYDRLFDEYERTTLVSNHEALKLLYSIFKKKKRVAITCFEAETCMCHRGRVANALEQFPDWEYDIKHI